MKVVEKCNREDHVRISTLFCLDLNRSTRSYISYSDGIQISFNYPNLSSEVIRKKNKNFYYLLLKKDGILIKEKCIFLIITSYIISIFLYLNRILYSITSPPTMLLYHRPIFFYVFSLEWGSKRFVILLSIPSNYSCMVSINGVLALSAVIELSNLKAYHEIPTLIEVGKGPYFMSLMPSIIL